MNPGWFFLIACLAMMVLCFLMMGRRAGSGGCMRWCRGRERRARQPRSFEGESGGEENRVGDEADRQGKGDRVSPVTPL